MTTTNSVARSSCTKCVEVLQELVSGLQQDNAGVRIIIITVTIKVTVTVTQRMNHHH